jgi:hypothetical protein
MIIRQLRTETNKFLDLNVNIASSHMNNFLEKFSRHKNGVFYMQSKITGIIACIKTRVCFKEVKDLILFCWLVISFFYSYYL